jgi:phenylpropionate dioxygenase-like ring-hydroxylating dioxygenase large terminal subunit
MRSETDCGLPAWTYYDEGFYAQERERIFAPSWQIVCHESDIAERGRYATLAFMGALVFVVRGDSGAIRAFRNVCRHRAARLLDAPFGSSGSRIVCPYHAWTYGLDGRLIGAPDRAGYEPFDPSRFSLVPVELGQVGGFIFVRMGGAEPFEEFSAPLREEFALYRTAGMKALGRVTLRERACNWKVATDNYVDALHLPVAHEGLNSLVGESYRLTIREDGAYHIFSTIAPRPNQGLSVRAYEKFLPVVEHLPEERRRAWVYLKLWPNLAFDFYPDQIDFMQFIPLSPTRTLLREISYALPDGRREMRAARYLNWRINRIVNVEDKDLIERVQEGYETGRHEGGYGTVEAPRGPLSASEICLKDFAERVRRAIPEAAEDLRGAARLTPRAPAPIPRA